MVALKLRKIGNSLWVVLPKAPLRPLRAGEGDEVLLVEGPKMEKTQEIPGRCPNTPGELAK
jgi:antitoxin component of MazEF toxin-antitoxin module